MRLCILADTIATDVSQITLKDGHIPLIRGHEHQGKNGLNDFLVEPSVWFKVLVVDVVVVNCLQRQLSWEMVSSPENDDDANCSGQPLDDFCLLRTVDDDNTRNGSAGVRGSIIRRPKGVMEPEAMSAEDSFDLDEVFDSLPGLVSDYERNAITAAQFHDSLMKFLHLYILPSIVLTARHTASMREGLRQQERFLQKINDDIEGTSRKLEAVTQSKTKLRRRFIPDITNNSSDLRYSRSLIVTLLNDINDEILDASKDLEVAQDDVDRTKRKQLETVQDSTDDDLAAARLSRNEVVQNYETLLTARENIVATKNATETMTMGRRHLLRVQRKSDNKPEHRIYEELTSIQDDLIRVMHSLAEKKLLSLSVKEAMKLTLAELETGADSCGVDVETIGYLKGSDVTDNGSATTGGGGSLWMTLAEQVAEIMANANHSVTKQHRKFCTSVAERCKAAIGERIIYETMRQLSDDKPSSPSSSETEAAPSVVKGNGRSSGNRITTSNSIFYDGNVSPDCCRVVVPEDAELNCANHPPPTPSPQDTKGGKGLGIFRKSKRPSRPTSSESNRSTGSRKSTTLYMLASSADDDTVIVYEENKNYARQAIKTLQDDITNHFEDLTEQLRVELRQKSITSLWLSYEPHFYDETIEHILTLYAIEYGAVTRTLGQTIRSLSATDLSFDDSILVRMLQETNTDDHLVKDGTVTPQSSPDHARSDVQSSPRTKTDDVVLYERSTSGVQPYSRTKTDDVVLYERSVDDTDNDTPFKRLSSAANPEVNVEDFLPRLRQISDGEAVELTDLKTSSHKTKLRKPSLSEPFSVTIRKSIRIAYPFSTVIVYDRTVCSDNNNPAAASTEIVNSSFKGVASNAFFRKPKQEPRPVRTMLMSAEYKRQFQQAFDFITVAVETQCPTTKFQQLAKCLRETSRQISIFCATVRGSTGVATCCDELMDGVILLLCNLDESVLSQLHIQILMLSDLIPPFFQSNSFSFTLVQFIGAFQFLKDTMLMRKQPTSPPSSRP